MASAKKHKYIFVVGGVMSGVGKGITTSSLGTILKEKGYTVNMVKVDPYLNVDAGTMNPTEHGEVFVLKSGLETDQDMGNYERFLNRDIDSSGYMTSGMVYKSVIDRERGLGYAGKCVEAIPDIRDEILMRLDNSWRKLQSEITIVEIGGTVGDYQNIMFFEAARVLKIRKPDDVIFVMVSYMPVPGKLGEMKSKPTQNAIRQLNSYGINTDFLIARSEVPMDQKRREKIAISCSVPVENVISAPDADCVYSIPLNFEKDNLGKMVEKALGLRPRGGNISEWKKFVDKARSTSGEVSIAIVGKYFDTGDFTLADSYLSVIEAVKFSAYWQGVEPKFAWVNAKDFEADSSKLSQLKKFHGIVVPGGFGEKGIEGKLRVIEYARKNKIPYFGLCYGMQLMVIEYARNVLKWTDASTAEINPKASKVVIDIMPDQKKKLAEGNYGGSMRLGEYPARLVKGSVAEKAYGTEEVVERHRHRYEVNPLYVPDIEKAGLIFSGKSPDGSLCEIAELPEKEHPFFLATQFHPEFLARPLSPHPLFTAFIKAALKRKK